MIEWKKSELIYILLFLTGYLFPPLSFSKSQTLSGFVLEHNEKCGNSGILILPEPGVKKKTYENLIQYFHGHCWDTWFLHLPEFTEYSMEDYAQAIKNSLSKIIIERFAVIVHGFSSLPYLVSIAQGSPPFKTVFISPVFEKNYPSRAVEILLVENSGKQNIFLPELLSLKPHKFKLSIPEILYLHDYDEKAKEMAKDYLGYIPSRILTDLNNWFLKGYLGDPLLLNHEKIKSLLTFPCLIITGQIDNFVPYYITYSFLRDKKNIEFFLASPQNLTSRNYGHLSLLIQKNARDDVFPVIYMWIEYGGSGKKWTDDIPF